MLSELLNLLNLLFMLWVIPLIALFMVLSPFLLYAYLAKKFQWEWAITKSRDRENG
mgnify:CR=1 FL=1